ncbi:sugar transferase [Kineosporia mesophila]|uniref:Sugar transferase n=1 Tax=Kineosporia mesophila TaxID=566012 RepID=A0ABP6Z1L7_9ACTN|nr:sugar transferase [Kineosporia mesophila]MCD5351158.1 sugar transferase [Kineosporia mesophila]
MSVSEASGAGLSIDQLFDREPPTTPSVPRSDSDRPAFPGLAPNPAEATFEELLLPSVRLGHRITRRLERPRVLMSRYSRYARYCDLAVGALAAALAVRVRFNTVPDAYLVLPLLLPLTWVTLGWLYRTYEHRYIGAGPDEYRRIARAGLILFACVAAAAYCLNGNFPRTIALMSVPFAVLGSMACRCVLRIGLRQARSTGKGLHRTIVVGRSNAAIALIEQLHQTESSLHHAIVPVGVCLPAGEVVLSHVHDVPVLGTPGDVLRAVHLADADAVAVVSQPDLSGHALRRLSWALEERGVELLVSPGIVEVAGPRLSIRPLAGMSLLHLERPVLKGTRRALKVAFDYSATLVLLTLLGPLMLTLALVVRVTSRGPALFRQTRVGTDGREFTVYKFRSMVVDAEARLSTLTEVDEGNGVLFKIRNDPRITRIGRVLRKYSLDELPQLLNVLRGNMSLVGPRPPLPTEVAGYSPTEIRRLRVRPGMTGLWQVSGRSDLTWEESLRLDLRYVDNWSLALDLSILWRTVRAVTQGSGAY